MPLRLLDTNIASAAIRGHRAIDARLCALPAGGWCISAVTRAELRFGVERRTHALQLARLVDAFLMVAQAVPWDGAAADAHGRLRAQLEAAGTRIGDFDEMIAAHALALGAVLVTDNTRHFRRVRGLELENWLR
ncbi:MAG: type II toxin-antitoxin system VapC family toxin [Betaproteobacteria bacterium]|nr:type II toxin-antitoxin system VapC family toxin [Betaproteobacteria bacterium]MDH5286234.1 type II toxin-antitoxin system VapC family toxin [Betaproteobacteria bacterium]